MTHAGYFTSAGENDPYPPWSEREITEANTAEMPRERRSTVVIRFTFIVRQMVVATRQLTGHSQTAHVKELSFQPPLIPVVSRRVP